MTPPEPHPTHPLLTTLGYTPLSHHDAFHHRGGRLCNVVLHDMLADRILANQQLRRLRPPLPIRPGRSDSGATGSTAIRWSIAAMNRFVSRTGGVVMRIARRVCVEGPFGSPNPDAQCDENLNGVRSEDVRAREEPVITGLQTGDQA